MILLQKLNIFTLLAYSAVHEDTINQRYSTSTSGANGESVWGIWTETEYFVSKKPQSADNDSAIFLFTT